MTGERNRDRSIEHLLRRSLGAGLEARVTDACLDAETLAAWVDGGLDEQAVAMAEAHASQCARCQALVGAMARSAPDVPVRAPWWRREWTLRWLVPLTAGAAAIALWIAVPDRPRSPAPAVQYDLQGPATPPQAVPPVAAEQLETRLRAAPEKQAAERPQAGAEQSNAATRETLSARPSEDRKTPLRESALEGRVAGQRALERTTPAAPPPAELPLAAQAKEAASPIEIVSPDLAIRWQLAPGGRVSYSTNGGVTWQALASGVSSDLTAGSSPSPSVCWLVGRGGVVLMTTDGRRLQRVPFPEVVDLTSVQAVTSGTVIVMTADGRTFRTQDAGKTWTQGPLQVF